MNWFRSAAVLAAGTALAQAISFALIPILTHLYTPQEYGVYGSIIAIVSIAASIATGKYELAIPLEEGEGQAETVLVLACYASVLACSLLGVALLIVSAFSHLQTIDQIARAVSSWWLLLPIAAFLFALNIALSQYNLRAREYGRQARARVVGSLTLALTQCTLAYTLGGTNALVIGLIASQLAATAVQSRGQISVRIFLPARERWVHLFERARHHRVLPLYQLPATLVETLTGFLPVLIIAPRYGPEVTGMLFLAFSLLKAPTAILSKAVGDVFYSTAAREFRRTGSLSAQLVAYLPKLAGAALVLYGSAYFVVQPLLGTILGSSWSETYKLVQLLLPLYALQFIVGPVSGALYIVSANKEDLVIQVFGLLAATAAVVVGIFVLNSFEGTLYLYTAAYLAKYLVTFSVIVMKNRGLSSE